MTLDYSGHGRQCSKRMLVSADLYISCSCVVTGQSPNTLTAFSPFFSAPISMYNSTACLKASRNELHRNLYQKEFSAQRRSAENAMTWGICFRMMKLVLKMLVMERQLLRNCPKKKRRSRRSRRSSCMCHWKPSINPPI